MPKSTYLANKINDHIYGATVFTTPATVYIALYSVTPGVSGGGTEYTGGGYARVAVANNTTNFPASSLGAKAVAIDVIFPALTADQADAVAFGVHDNISAGNLLEFGAISPGKSCLAGDSPYFPSGTGLVFTES